MMKVSSIVLFATLLVTVYSWPNSPGFTNDRNLGKNVDVLGNPVEDGRNGNCNCPGGNSNNGYKPSNGYQPTNGFNPNNEYQPTNGYNPNNGYRPTNGFDPNSAFNRKQPE